MCNQLLLLFQAILVSIEEVYLLLMLDCFVNYHCPIVNHFLDQAGHHLMYLHFPHNRDLLHLLRPLVKETYQKSKVNSIYYATNQNVQNTVSNTLHSLGHF